MAYLRVKNWEKFQHYHRRDAPWIKFYTGLLDDYDFGRLPTESKAELMLIWLLAQRTDNKIKNDPVWVQARIGTSKKPNLQILIDAGFVLLEDHASTPMLALGEERRGEEIRTPLTPQRGEEVTAEDLARVWNENRGAMRKVALPLNADRKRKAKARLSETPDLERWKLAIIRAAKSKFCRGLVPAAEEGRKPWIGNFEWLLRPNSLDRIEEGVYDSQPQSPRLVPQAAPVLTDEERKFIEETGTDEQRKRMAQASPS